MDIEVNIIKTYDDNQHFTGMPNKVIRTTVIGVIDLPQLLHELSLMANEHYPDEGELVISFPYKDKKRMLVEIYNGYRE